MIESPKKPACLAKSGVRVRFAPSPTGFLHIGSARTVLFNWLFAKQQDGKFILRIEDTDIERSEPRFEHDIIEGMKWLGLDWDEGIDIGGEYGPYRQSERLDIYEKYLRQLIDENKAYYCFCSKEQLEGDRQAMLAQGLAPKYSGRCRHLLREESEKRIAEGESAVIRFKTPETEIEFNDLIRGKIKVNTALIGDIVIARSLRSPLFVFSGAVDDFEMKITHVIRGEDHISNTPKQILIQKVLGFDELKYAHLPLILSSDRSKMSKRFLDTALADYRKQGYLPEAIVNFLALLGWHPKDEKEIFSPEELIKEFDIKRIQKAGAIFNLEKLEWLNAQYIRKLNQENLMEKIKEFIPPEWGSEENKELLIKAIAAEKERMRTLADFKKLADFFFELPDYEPKLLAWPRLTNEAEIDKEKTLANLKILIEEINKVFKADFNKENLEESIMSLTEIWGRGELLWPLRAALSGRETSPGPFKIMEVLGKEETLRRLNIAIEKLS
ncbi:MAG: glutamate--tRNA ligase [bacterium]|nr:glutamate--tRNA ligase [bacterium]